MKKLTTCLWFDHQAEEAAQYYLSIFKDSKMGRISHYGTAGYEVHGRAAGTVMTVEFELNGQQFMGLNGGPVFTFNDAVSIVVNCKDQAEVDYYWEKLTADGGQEIECGWLKDKYGLSWQIVPEVLGELMNAPDREKANRVMGAMMQMKKLDIQSLSQA